jgi:sec-independent protein translocase protein TatA
MIGMQELILILAILLLVFGPSKLPKLARELGKAWREFNKASSEAMGAINSTTKIKNKTENKPILDFANKLGLNVAGKTDKQITDLVVSKILNSEKTPS